MPTTSHCHWQLSYFQKAPNSFWQLRSICWNIKLYWYTCALHLFFCSSNQIFWTLMKYQALSRWWGCRARRHSPCRRGCWCLTHRLPTVTCEQLPSRPDFQPLRASECSLATAFSAHAREFSSAHEGRTVVHKCPSFLALWWDNVRCSRLPNRTEPQLLNPQQGCH